MDLDFQNFSTVQSNQQAGPNTVASAATIAPVSFLTIITGTTQIANITPPVTGIHMLALVFTDGSPGTTLTSGNILNAVIPTQNLPSFFIYNPITAKYYGCTTNLT